MIKQNKHNGSILIATTILYLLISISVGFVLLNVSEINEARRYYHSTAAFWLAEAGINMFVKNPDMLSASFSKSISYGDGVIHLTRDDSRAMFRDITATGIVGGVQKKIQISYVAHVPEAYRNTISSRGNITITGQKASFIVNDKTRLSGKLINHSKFGSALFEDAQYNQDNSLTSLSYPNTNQNETNNEFQDFIQNNQDLISTYPPDEILHIKTNGTFKLPTDGSLKGKKIIFVEGPEGGGDVVIESTGAVSKDQSLTVISTGSIRFNQSGTQAPNSQLNFIAWQGYHETVSAPSSYQGLIYTHGSVTFDQINASSINNGGIIADRGIEFGEVWSTKIFNYADMLKNGHYPPGFEKLTGSSLSGIVTYPSSWRELQN